MSSNSYLTRLKRQILSHVTLVRWVLGVSALLAIIAVSLWIRQPARQLTNGLKQTFTDNLPQHQGRINFLVMGIGGENHEGSDLTDSMVFISVDVESGESLLLSIPRDIWVSSLKAKINTAYHYGELRQTDGGGLILAKAAVSEIISQPIDFAAVIDFSTFTKLIDMLGGIEVDVENSFDDHLYPVAGRENDLCNGDPEYRCRYQSIHFDQGLQHMDGQTALKYVRSRHSDDSSEGSDFARSRRQERIINAIKSKLLTTDILKQSKQIQGIKDLLLQSIKTDITSEYYYHLVRLGLKMKTQTIQSKALVEPDQLYHPTVPGEYGNLWVLLPKDNLTSSVSAWLENHSN